MTGSLWPVLADAPARERWDFGGYPYGLEPLTLPAPRRWAQATDSAAIATGMTRAGRPPARVSLVEEFGVPPRLAASAADTERLYWFRWITGHQVCFILWQLIGRLMRDAEGGDRAPADAVGPLRHYVRGCCAMLLYTGSCPRDMYESVIRPSMRLQHPAFSGSWAPDFRPVRDLLRGQSTAFAGVPGAEDLAEAVQLHTAVHEEVAARLVPDGWSLLGQADVRLWKLPVMRLMYDNFFLTVRAAIAEDAVTAQLLRRLVAIARDVRANRPHLGDSRSGAKVAASDATFTELLDDVAWAAERPWAPMQEATE